MSERQKEVVIVVGLLALAAMTRFYLSTFPGFSVDIAIFAGWAERLADVGPRHVYENPTNWGVLPVHLYILWPIGEIHKAFFADLRPDDTAYLVLLKIPANVCDILSAALIYVIVRKSTSISVALAGTALYLFNPAIFYDSAVWGQFDGVLTFFLLVSVYLLLSRQPELACIFMAVAFLTKAQAIALVPIFVLALVLRLPPYRIVSSLAVGAATFFLLALPFFPNNPILGMPDLVEHLRNAFQLTSLNAFNLWWIVTDIQPDSGRMVMGLSAEEWGRLLWIGSQVVLGIWLVARRKSEWSVYWACSLALFSFFILPTRIHERYLFPFFSFFLVAALTSRHKVALVTLYLALSLLDFFNIYYGFYATYPQATSQTVVGWASHGDLYSYLNVIIYCVLIILSFIALIPRVSRWYGSAPPRFPFDAILRQKSRLLGIDTEPPRV